MNRRMNLLKLATKEQEKVKGGADWYLAGIKYEFGPNRPDGGMRMQTSIVSQMQNVAIQFETPKVFF